MNTNIIKEQIKASIIFQYLLKYNIMEISIKQLFVKCLDDVPQDMKNRLYFIYGSKISSYFDYSEDSLKANEKKFNVKESFSELTINQIIKLNKRHCFLPNFGDLESQNSSRVSFNFMDCIIKLIETRNILAHELASPEFKDKHIIERFNDEKIKALNYDFLANYDVSMIDDQSKNVLCNLFYLDKVINSISSILNKTDS